MNTTYRLRAMRRPAAVTLVHRAIPRDERPRANASKFANEPGKLLCNDELQQGSSCRAALQGASKMRCVCPERPPQRPLSVRLIYAFCIACCLALYLALLGFILEECRI